MDVHKNGPLRNRSNFRPIFFYKNSHVLQKYAPKYAKVYLDCDRNGYAIIK